MLELVSSAVENMTVETSFPCSRSNIHNIRCSFHEHLLRNFFDDYNFTANSVYLLAQWFPTFSNEPQVFHEILARVIQKIWASVPPPKKRLGITAPAAVSSLNSTHLLFMSFWVWTGNSLNSCRFYCIVCRLRGVRQYYSPNHAATNSLARAMITMSKIILTKVCIVLTSSLA